MEERRPAVRRVDEEPTEADVEEVTRLLGRHPAGGFRIVVRHLRAGDPVVIRNDPLLDDGRPMPTRYWLVGEPERTLIGRLESRGGVRRAEEAVGLLAIAQAHDVYAAEREAAMPPDWEGPRPIAGVGGTRIGVKCLHAHYAWYLAGGNDPVGRWVADRIDAGEGDRDWLPGPLGLVPDPPAGDPDPAPPTGSSVDPVEDRPGETNRSDDPHG